MFFHNYLCVLRKSGLMLLLHSFHSSPSHFAHITFYLSIFLEVNLAFTDNAEIIILAHIPLRTSVRGSLEYTPRIDKAKLFLMLSELVNPIAVYASSLFS